MSQEYDGIVEPTEILTDEEVVSEETPEETPPNPLEALRLPEDDSIDPTYRGKSALEIIEMHKNATKRLGEQGQELGTFRSLANDLSQQLTRTANPQPQKQPEPTLTPEDLLTDPQAKLSALIDARIAERVNPINQERQREALERAEAQLRTDYPGAEALVATPEFQSWAAAKPGRAADLQAAVQGDMVAGRRLLETWSELHPTKPDESETPTEADTAKPQGVDGARRATTESGGTGRGTASGKIYFQADIIKMIRDEPDKYYSDQFQQELTQAAREDRVRY